MTEPFPLSQCKTLSSLDFERLDKSAYLLEPKIDGWRIQMNVDPQGVQPIEAWTRTNHDATGKMPEVERHLLHMARTEGHSFRLDGEAVWLQEDGTPDYNFTARCLGSYTDVCVMKQQEAGGDIAYFVFDILMLDDRDRRMEPLEMRKKLLRNHLGTTGTVNIVLGDEPSEEQHAFNFDQYFEGSVLKELAAPYAGKRHKSWLKLKEVETADVRIIGYKNGQGKFEGLIGAIKFKDPKTGVIGFCSGMDDATRIYISDHYKELIGKYIEVKHYGLLVDGYRHPQFQRFRDDL